MTGRDLSPLLEHGRCTVCGEAAPERQVVPWVEAHATRHLASGEAVVVIETRRNGAPRRERVVPQAPDDVTDDVDVAKRAVAKDYARKHRGIIRLPKKFQGVFKP